jgi:hypothetical protein
VRLSFQAHDPYFMTVLFAPSAAICKFTCPSRIG